MGLDMYLKKETYIGAGYEHRDVKGNIQISISGKTVPINLMSLHTIVEDLGYWRKANHIHKWFVDNVQDGEDNCGRYSVQDTDLERLLEACNEALSKKEAEVGGALPTQKGFFFGSTDYDDYYYETTKYTKELIESILADKKAGKYSNSDVYYVSSW